MSYNVLTIPPFDKQLKRLAKKYPSLKNEFARLIVDIAENPKMVLLPGTVVIKSVWLLLPRARAKAVGQE